MTLLITAETILLALLTLLVAGLLRSHAEILRALGEPGAAAVPTGDEELPPPTGVVNAMDIDGETLDRRLIPVRVRDRGVNTLLAFLSTSCSTCIGFWERLREGEPLELPPETELVIVAKDRSEERLSRLRKLSDMDSRIIMSTQAWRDYNVSESPYFVFVDGQTGLVRGEGSADTWERAFSLVNDSIDEDEVERADRASGLVMDAAS